jgi:hypothetical protein
MPCSYTKRIDPNRTAERWSRRLHDEALNLSASDRKSAPPFTVEEVNTAKVELDTLLLENRGNNNDIARMHELLDSLMPGVDVRQRRKKSPVKCFPLGPQRHVTATRTSARMNVNVIVPRFCRSANDLWSNIVKSSAAVSIGATASDEAEYCSKSRTSK